MKGKYATTLFTTIALGMLVFAGCKRADTFADTAKKQYTFAMHPEVVTTTPGKCPKCGMDLTEKK